MQRTSFYSKLREIFDEKVALKLSEAIEEEFINYEKLVTKDEFNELKEIVRDLAEAQKGSEERLSKLEEKMAELAEAQKKTEQRVNELVEAQKRTEERLSKLEEKMAELAEAQKKTEQRVNELAEAQKRTEQRVNELAEAQKRTEQRLNELAEAQKRTEQRVNELAEAQKRTEQRVNELAEAQKRTEQRVNQLAEAQKKTEEEIRKLTKTVGNLQIEVGGISDSIGHPLEDKAIAKLPKILKEEYGIELEGELKRGFMKNKNGKYEEINIYGFGKKNGKKIFILGEGKARFGKKDYNKFKEKMGRFEGEYGEVVPVIVTYIFANKELEDRVREKGILCFLSYELERK